LVFGEFALSVGGEGGGAVDAVNGELSVFSSQSGAVGWIVSHEFLFGL
jgi:hypothetical protein